MGLYFIMEGAIMGATTEYPIDLLRIRRRRKLGGEGTLENPGRTGAEGARPIGAESLRPKDRADISFQGYVKGDFPEQLNEL